MIKEIQETDYLENINKIKAIQETNYLENINNNLSLSPSA